MKAIKILAGLVMISSMAYSQAVSVTQYNPFYQTPNQWGGGQSWTALGLMYNDFVSLNNIAVGTTLNNTLVGNNTFTGTMTITGHIANLGATVYSDSVGTNVALTASQSGLVVLMKFLAGDTISLPASASCAVGTQFDVRITYSSSSIGHCIQTNGSDVFYGTLFEMSTTTVSPFLSTANKRILLTPTTKCGLAGGSIRFIYLGGGRWQTSGTVYGSGTVATAFSN